MKKVIASPDAPNALGPYSQAVAVGNLLFCSGQVPLVPETGKIVAGDIRIQTARVIENLTAVLKANGMTLANVVKTTVFMVDLNEFSSMNDVYASYFAEPFPARSTVQVSALPKGARLEIEAIAMA